MSDDFRIYGRHSGQGAYQGQKSGENLARFKRTHKTGDMVSGLFIRLEPANAGTAWINFDGAMLLAGLPRELADLAILIFKGQGAGATPTGVREEDFPLRHGDTCYFILEATEPEPVLRMLSLNGASGSAIPLEEALEQEHQAALRRSIFALPLPQIAARYSQKRQALDAALHERLWQDEDLQIPFPAFLPEALVAFAGTELGGAAEGEDDQPWRNAQARYISFVRDDAVAAVLYGDLNLYRAALHENLRPYGVLGFFYTPWLCPPSKAVELLFYEPSRFKVPAPSAMTAEAMAGVHYKLQGSMSDAGAGALQIQEISGVVGHASALRRQLAPENPDILRFLISLKPQSIRSGFSLKA